MFAVNRSQNAALPLEIDLRDGGYRLVEAVTYSSEDHMWHATADDDTSVLPVANETAALDGSVVSASLPAISWSMIRLAKA